MRTGLIPLGAAIGGVATAILLLTLAAATPGQEAEDGGETCGLFPAKDWILCDGSCPERPINRALVCVRRCLNRYYECRQDLKRYGANLDSVDPKAKDLFRTYHPEYRRCMSEEPRRQDCIMRCRVQYAERGIRAIVRCIRESGCAKRIVCAEFIDWPTRVP